MQVNPNIHSVNHSNIASVFTLSLLTTSDFLNTLRANNKRMLLNAKKIYPSTAMICQGDFC